MHFWLGNNFLDLNLILKLLLSIVIDNLTNFILTSKMAFLRYFYGLS